MACSNIMEIAPDSLVRKAGGSSVLENVHEKMMARHATSLASIHVPTTNGRFCIRQY